MIQQCLIFKAFFHEKYPFKYSLINYLIKDVFLKSPLSQLCAKKTEFQMAKVLEDW